MQRQRSHLPPPISFFLDPSWRAAEDNRFLRGFQYFTRHGLIKAAAAASRDSHPCVGTVGRIWLLGQAQRTSLGLNPNRATHFIRGLSKAIWPPYMQQQSSCRVTLNKLVRRVIIESIDSLPSPKYNIRLDVLNLRQEVGLD